MATYLRGITDTVPQITPFQPDFGMVQKTLSLMQSRYDKGFAMVQNVYNQVLNAPLSDANNKTVRDAFVKDAERKLKDISSVDLSIPENQVQAENVFAPFWQDDMILQDATLTKWYQSEMQKAQATRDSQDEKIRSQYSDAAVRYLQNGLEKLQGAGRDSSKYAQLEKRRFVPFQDMKAYLNKQATDAGLKVVWESADGPYLVKQENGVRSEQAFETFAENMLGDQFQDQFRVMGVVDKEERIKQMKRINPALTDEQAMAEVAKGIGEEYHKTLSSREKSLQSELEKTAKDLEQYKALPGLDAAQVKRVEELGTYHEHLKRQLDGVNDNLTNYKDKAQDIYRNPDGYFTSVMKQRAIKGWANARAAGEQVTVSENSVWKTNMDIAYRQRQLEIEVQKLGLDAKNYELKKWVAQHPLLKDGSRLGGDGFDLFGDSGDLSGGIGLSGGGTGLSSSMLNPERAGRIQGLGSTDITKVGNPYQLFQERQMQRWGIAHNELFSDAAGGKVLQNMGVPLIESSKYLNAIKKYSLDLSGRSLSKQDHDALHELSTKLTGKEVPTYAGFFQLRSKMLDNMKTTLENKLKDGGTGLKQDDANMLFGYLTSTLAMQEHDALEEQRKVLVQQQITKDPKTFSKILVRKNGQNDIADVDDIVKDFKPIKLQKYGDQSTMTLNPRQFAEMYINGEFNYTGQGEVFIGGQKYSIAEFDGKTGGFTDNATSAFNDYYYDRSGTKDITRSKNPNALEYKYGSSQDQKKLRDQLNAKVVPNLPEYQSQTGKMGFVVRYDLGEKGTADVGSLLVQEAADPSNHMGIYVGGKLSQDDEQNKAIMNLMSLNESKLKDFVSTAFIKPVGPNGRPSLEVKLNPVKDTDKTKFSDVELKTLAGLDKIEFELNPDARGDMLRKIRYNSGMYVYGSILRGKSFSSDAMLKAAGFAFDIAPDDPPTSATVEVRTKEFVNGAYVDAQPKRQKFSFDRITPDELVNNMYSFFVAQMNKNLVAQQTYQQRLGQGQGVRMTADQVLANLRNRWAGR